MAVEVLDYQGFSKLQRERDVDEAVMGHLQSMQNLVSLLAKQPHQPAKQQDCALMADASKADFKRLITLLGGSGHARFRRAPVTRHTQVSSQRQNVPGLRDKVRSSTALPNAEQIKQVLDIDDQPNQLCSPCKEGNGDQNHSSLHVSGHARCRDATAQKISHQGSAESSRGFAQVQKNMPCQLRHHNQSCTEQDRAPKTNSSFCSLLSMDGAAGTVSSGKPVFSSGRPPLPPKKREAPEKTEERTMKCHNSVNCHCAKRRKLKTRRILRVSTVGLSNGDIPEDGYSWCKYRERFSTDTSQPRVYYKCSSVRGCCARKHVERVSDDPNTSIVTYGREHMHPPIRTVLKASERERWL